MKLYRKFKEKVSNIFINTQGISILLKEAEVFEKNNDYESACYFYACAIDQGEKDAIYKYRINELYKQYGPFNFNKQLARMKKEFCNCCESCGEGYHIGIVKIINNIIEKD